MVPILVLTMIIACLAIDYFVRRNKEAAAPAKAAAPAFSGAISLPGGYFLSKAHTWVQMMFSGEVRVGVDEFIHNLVGAADKIEVVPLNSEVHKGEPLFILRRGDRKLSFRAPVSGRVIGINKHMEKADGLLAADPYQGGWIIALQPNKFGEESRLFTIADEANAWLKNEVTRFRDFLQEQISGTKPALAGSTLLDGGIPARGVLQQFDAKAWESFEQKFLAE